MYVDLVDIICMRFMVLSIVLVLSSNRYCMVGSALWIIKPATPRA